MNLKLKLSMPQPPFHSSEQESFQQSTFSCPLCIVLGRYRKIIILPLCKQLFLLYFLVFFILNKQSKNNRKCFIYSSRKGIEKKGIFAAFQALLLSQATLAVVCKGKFIFLHLKGSPFLYYTPP